MRDNQSSRQQNTKTPEELWRERVESVLGKDYVQKILAFGEDLDINEFKKFNERIQNFIRERTEGITSSRLRKVYDLIKKAKNISELLYTIPYLAYMVGREESKRRKEALGELYVVLKEAIEKAENDKHVKNIQKFTEALVAYQKFYGKD
ncbi:MULTISPECIES: type III-A CRISPR-associated protein Csm2 [Dictyoglomus]|uniref:CRISPR system Cms protein Csm2 n=2 Tax=Dictyoglomus turgidum TaxID=513050 RepID=B8DZG6_DICTD|nr:MULTISPECIES: type III-A CRISPR-associated protein Csm2 [Dictyoglomus]ACK41899.1 CRISPR-associated protein, Csm2 family [Dictyoglomus turgidum DSM 6724]HBU31247.1 type III-A CRISPR-associated protein Csm2 [Dictyoglomus sp.]